MTVSYATSFLIDNSHAGLKKSNESYLLILNTAME